MGSHHGLELHLPDDYRCGTPSHGHVPSPIPISSLVKGLLNCDPLLSKNSIVCCLIIGMQMFLSRLNGDFSLAVDVPFNFLTDVSGRAEVFNFDKIYL